MLLVMVLLAGAPDEGSVDAMVASYRAQTAAEIPCKAPGDGSEITVCARRQADRYRVPLVQSADPRNSVPVRTARLLEDHGPPCGEGAFLKNCGMVGVTITANARGVHLVERELAP